MAHHEDDGDDVARRIADYERLSGYLWIGLGALQVLAIVTVIAGLWNVWAGFSRLATAKRVRAREASVPADYEGVTQLVVIALINLVVGGAIGLIFVGLDVFIRDRVLSNRWVFAGCERSHALLGGRRLGVLEQLGRLRASGVLSEVEFAQEKARVLLG